MNDFIFSEIISKMIEYNDPDLKRINHAMKVFSFTQALCFREKVTADIQLVAGITGILHDIGIHEAEKKYNSSGWNYQEKEGPGVARGLLENMAIDQAIKERCYYIIGKHHSYKEIAGLDFQILVEADFFVNIHEDGEHSIGRRKLADEVFKTTTGKEMLLKLYGSN